MNIDFLISKAGLRVAGVELHVTGVRLVRGATSFVTQSAELITGSMTLALTDISAALARPEVIDQLISGVSGIARPEFTLADGAEGGIRIIGSVEVIGRRFPITAASDVRIEDNRVVVSAGHIEGLPLIGLLSPRLPQFVLPLALPAGLAFTGVTTEPGGIVVTFEGRDVWLSDTPRAVPVVPAPTDTPEG